MDLLRARAAVYEPDIICVNEIKPKNYRYKPFAAESSLSDIGYDMIPNNLDNEIGRGQIIYYARDRILLRQEEFEESKFEEAVFASMKLSDNDSLLVGLFYRSGSSTQLNCKRLNNLINGICNKGYSHMLLVGDFNYPDADWTRLSASSTISQTFMDTTLDNFLHQHVDKPTRYRENDSPSTIDLVFTNEDDMVEDIDYNSALGLSDHLTLLIKYNCYWSQEKQTKKVKLYHKADYGSMKESLNQIDWPVVMEDKNYEESCKTLEDILNDLIDKHVPVMVKKTNRHKVPIEKHVRDLIKQKDRLCRKEKELRKQLRYADAHKIRTEYVKVRNKVRKETRTARKRMENDLAKEAKTNTKKIYAYMNSRTKLRPGVGKICKNPANPKSDKTDNDKQKAKIFAKFFSEVQITEPDGDPPELDEKHITHPMPDLVILIETVEAILRNLKEGKSPGPDNLAPALLKELAKELAQPVQILYTKSLAESGTPESWLIAHVSVIYKKGTKSLPGNYRPISLTSILSKSLEIIVRDHIMNHMKVNKLFSNKQYGFLPGRSTTLQLLRALDDWTLAMDNGNDIDCIYTDFRKAFDTVPHKRLLNKLKAYGISSQLMKWITSWISNRRQKVIINGEESEWTPVTSGVPQGSVLGPLLFVIFINDLPEHVISSLLLLYADDSKVYKEIKCAEDHLALQADLNSMSEWSKEWLLEFAPDKLKRVTISRKQYQKRMYHVGQYPVSESVCEKDLGVYIDPCLSFQHHISEKVKTANKIVGAIRRSFRYLDQNTFCLLYKSLVRCHLETSVAVWCPATERDIDLLEGVQRRATKMLPGMKSLSYEARLRKLKLPTLKYRRTRGDMIETFKILSEKYDPDVVPILILRDTVQSRSNARGNALTLFQGRSKLEVRRNSFTQRIIPVWNSLPDKVVTSNTMNSFKQNLDTHWSHQDLLYDHKAILTGVRHRGVIIPCIEA
jgi:hypothetical protein